MKTHKDLEVYKKSVELVTEVYKATKEFPKEELFGLVSQIRRSAVSIPSNIAEGAARNHTKEFIRFLRISLGSAAELETQLEISRNLQFVNDETLHAFETDITSIKRMLHGLIKAVMEKSD